MLISLIQPNFQQGPKEFNAHYLPYSVGVLWSYVNQFAVINENYALDKIVWHRSEIEVVAQQLRNNNVVLFSTYVWNKNYNYALARRLKEINPECITIFGGPELPFTKLNIFEKCPFIDIVIKGEGEITLKNILECIVEKKLFVTVTGLVINQNGVAVDTGASTRIDNQDDIPSPYLTGVFDGIMAETTGIEWNATLETNRGCPYQCTFCDWGSLTYNKVKKFNIDRVFAELDWIAKNKCGFVTITDANFGMFVERDDAIANKLLALQDEYGYPASLSITWAKNQKPEVFAIVAKLIKSPRFNSGLTVSVQSMDTNVLENIKRKNLDQHKISDIFATCEKYNVPVYTEVILGLPGETISSWKNGIWKLFRAGNHTGLNILHAQLLENAEMNLTQREIYSITSVQAYDYMSGSYNDDSLKECVEIVTSTVDMPPAQMRESQLFNCFIDTFHISGLTTYISRILYGSYNIDYSVFYEKLHTFLQTTDWYISESTKISALYDKWMTTGRIDHPGIENIEIHGWNVNHLITIGIHANNEYDVVFNLIKQFLSNEFMLDREFVSQLIRFQRNYVINYHTIPLYPIIESYDYDFMGYLLTGTALHQSVTYEFSFFEEADISMARFLESIYFGRKRNFGKALVRTL